MAKPALSFALALVACSSSSDGTSRVARTPPADARPDGRDAPAPEPPPPAPVEPDDAPAPAPAPVVGIHRVASVDASREGEAREAVRSARRDWDRERRRRPRGAVAAARSDLVAAELESAIGALAMTLCEGFQVGRTDALVRLTELAERVIEATEAIDPRAGQRCLREGGDPADCELIDGQQYTELGEVEHQLEESRRRAAIDALQSECAPGDPDLAPPAAGAPARGR